MWRVLSLLIVALLIAYGVPLCADEADVVPSRLSRILVGSGATDRGTELATTVLAGLDRGQFADAETQKKHDAALAYARKKGNAQRYAAHLLPLFADQFTEEELEGLEALFNEPLFKRWRDALTERADDVRKGDKAWRLYVLREYNYHYVGLR